jgi:bacterioferritin-associated ferredoxin
MRIGTDYRKRQIGLDYANWNQDHRPAMIVCSCSLITAKEVAEAVEAIRVADPSGKVKMERIYQLLGKRPSCGGCGRLVKDLVVSPASPPPRHHIHPGPLPKATASSQ